MDISPSGIIRNWVPSVPGIVKTAALSLIGQSPNSEHQDVLTETIVASARPILQTPAALAKSQVNVNRDYGVWGRIWVSKYTIPLPSQPELEFSIPPSSCDASIMTVREAVDFAIRTLTNSAHKAESPCAIPSIAPVETEWTAYRPNVSHISPRPRGLSEHEQYGMMMRDVDSAAPTILHLHGGAYCLMDPSTHRWTTSALSKAASNARVLSVRYRLSPQNIFPAALIDAFTAYLSLLSPPPDSFHSPVSASKITISGDSSGGGLASSLTLLLLTLAKHSISIRYHDELIKIPSPVCAGLTLTSPWLDITRSLPSTIHNARYDIIAPPPIDNSTPPFPTDAIWPTSPPRAETYCSAQLATHPLVSPLAATSAQWQNAPPLYVNCGWEGFTDEIEVFTRRVYLSSRDAVVRFEGWEGMPHCFCMVPWNHAGFKAMAGWGEFCRDVVLENSTVSSPVDSISLQTPSTSEINDKKLPSSTKVPANVVRTDVGTWTSSKTGIVRTIRLEDLGLTRHGSGYEREVLLTDEIVEGMMDKGREWRIRIENDMVRRWKDDLDSKEKK